MKGGIQRNKRKIAKLRETMTSLSLFLFLYVIGFILIKPAGAYKQTYKWYNEEYNKNNIQVYQMVRKLLQDAINSYTNTAD